ncbi:TolC family protein [Sanyastnella coralliicola]|uniref:TolC family protein n=1 Tax=Sanyastnella coralliicola TaxID=3069118 RepID=UPI0027B9200F|nr:TolC family protein [Longitalea sp. SCSIO 12813]
MNKLILVLLFLACGGTFSALAQENLSLEDAIRFGLDNNFQIKIAKLNTDIAENNNSWGQTSALPSLNLTGSYSLNITDNSENPTSFIQAKLESEGVQYGANLNWTLFDGFGMFAQKRQLELLEALSEGNAAVVIENTVQGIVLAYYDVQVQQEKLDVLEEVIALSRDRLEYMELKKELGASTTFEILQFENAIVSDSTNYLLQQLALDNAMRNLNLLLQTSDTVWELTTDLSSPGQSYDYNTLWDEVKNSNQQLRNVMANKLLSEQQLRSAKANMYPVVSFNAGINQSDNNFSAGELSGSGRTLNYFGTFTLNFNLFNGGKTRTAIKNAQISEEIANYNQIDLQLNVSTQLRNAVELYNAQFGIYNLTAENVANQKLALDIAEERYNNGVINSFDYRTQQVAYLNAAIGRIEALKNLLDTNANLVRLRGGYINPG